MRTAFALRTSVRAVCAACVPTLATLATLALVLLAAAPSEAGSESARAQLERGNADYEAGEFESAAEAYEAVLAAGVNDATAHYNLANTYFKIGRLGLAITHYRRAHALAPRDEDILANLEYARFLVLDSLEEDAKTDLRVEGWIDRVTPAEASQVPRVLWLLAGLAGVVWQLTPRGERAAKRSLVVLLVLWALSFAVAGAVQFRAGHLNEAVVLPAEVEVRSGPGESFDIAFELHEGAEVVVEGARGSWTEISLPGDLRGWIASDRIARL